MQCLSLRLRDTESLHNSGQAIPVKLLFLWSVVKVDSSVSSKKVVLEAKGQVFNPGSL